MFDAVFCHAQAFIYMEERYESWQKLLGENAGTKRSVNPSIEPVAQAQVKPGRSNIHIYAPTSSRDKSQ